MPRNWLFFKLIPSPSFCRVHHATCCSVGTVHVMHFIICGHSVCIAVGLLQPANIKTDARCANQAFLLNCVTNLSFLLHIFPFLFSSAFFTALVWCIRREPGIWSTTTWLPKPADRSAARYSLISQPFSFPRHQKLKHGQAPLASLLWR